MIKLHLTHNNNTYDITSRENSDWKNVYINGNPPFLVIDNSAAFQLIYEEINKTGTIGVLTEKDFTKVTI